MGLLIVPLKIFINASLTSIENHVPKSSEQLKSPFYSVSRDSPPAAAKEKGITGTRLCIPQMRGPRPRQGIWGRAPLIFILIRNFLEPLFERCRLNIL